MIEGVRDSAITAGLTQASEFDQGIRDLYRTAADDGVFCYTFFKATATSAPAAIQRSTVRSQSSGAIVAADPLRGGVYIMSAPAEDCL